MRCWDLAAAGDIGRYDKDLAALSKNWNKLEMKVTTPMLNK